MATLEGMDIKTDDDLLGILDELRHGLKAGQPYSYMRADFANVVVDFLKRWRLDEAQHSFAEWPKDPNAAANVCRDKMVDYCRSGILHNEDGTESYCPCPLGEARERCDNAGCLPGAGLHACGRLGKSNYGAQNTAVDGTPDIATGPTCTGVAGEASAPSDTDPV